MYDSAFQVLFLGEDFAWAKLSHSLVEAPHSNLKVHRAQSLNELFLVLAGGNWQAVALDVQAWNFQGLHYVEKIRSQYPAFPILALFSSAANLLSKAETVGASRCLCLEQLTAEALHSAVLSCLSENKSQPPLRSVPLVQPTFDIPDGSSTGSSKNQVISHALNNLLCVITANADLLSEYLNSSGPGARSLEEIKKAARSAADLMRMLK